MGRACRRRIFDRQALAVIHRRVPNGKIDGCTHCLFFAPPNCRRPAVSRSGGFDTSFLVAMQTAQSQINAW